MPSTRVLVVGWPSFIHGEATAGDVLAMEAVREELGHGGIECDLAWSQVFRPGDLGLEEADPHRYTHLVFACGPVRGPQVAQLHERFAHCVRIAVGVSVIDSDDPAASGFDAILARDGDRQRTSADLALQPRTAPVPVVGVILVGSQEEYGDKGRHDQVSESLTRWLRTRQCALLPLSTRLDREDWRLCEQPGELESLIRRVDLVVTTRLHGLVLALKNGIPALAVDPVQDGAKVTAQASTWGWPAIVAVSQDGTLDRDQLDRWWQWCRSDAGRSAASAASGSPPRTPAEQLLPTIGRLHRADG